jgi:hypothetical protein
MAETPTFNDAPDSSDGLISGIPAVVEYSSYLLSLLPDILTDATNEVLAEHVEASRESLLRDDDYSALASYYDVVQDEDEGGVRVNSDGGTDELVFGLFDVPAKHHNRAMALEFGDPATPPRAFVRRTVFKEADKVGDAISQIIRKEMGEVVASA